MELNIRIAGAAGQGLATTAHMLGRAMTRSGLFAYCRNDAESRIRGGLNFSHLRCSNIPLNGVTDATDILIALTPQAMDEFGGLINSGGVAICLENWGFELGGPFFLKDLAMEAGSIRAAGTVGLGAVAAMAGLEEALVEQVVNELFDGRDKLAGINVRAFELGYAAVGRWSMDQGFRLPEAEPPPIDSLGRRMYLSGAQAIALGAVAGGVTFMAGYPMSPATGVMTNLAAWSTACNLVVEQAEDEVAAINMVAGASFAGARAMTATSGGGLCLMTEGVSLLGMIEAPAVIVLAQRPGPATGLPTRMAQGDLNLARFAGHGTFSRIILAPRSIRDCFEVTAHAFDLAEKYQAPVFIMTDQLLQDSVATIDSLFVDGLATERYFMSKAELDGLDKYNRYMWSDNGVSPIAAPGVSAKLVVADSDEHDEAGHLTEQAQIAEKMAAKRLAKNDTIIQVAWPPELDGSPLTGAMVVGWGSAYETIAEACRRLGDQGQIIAQVNFSWLWPLPKEEIRKLFSVPNPLILVEASIGGELASIIKEVALREPDICLTKLDGRPFNVEHLVGRLKRFLNQWSD